MQGAPRPAIVASRAESKCDREAVTGRRAITRAERFGNLKPRASIVDDENVELASSPSPRRNGGFPEPPAGLAVRKVLATHDECGAVTPLRVPAELPQHALRRIVCDGCGEAFDPTGV